VAAFCFIVDVRTDVQTDVRTDIFTGFIKICTDNSHVTKVVGNWNPKQISQMKEVCFSQGTVATFAGEVDKLTIC